jgi:hypothetical protein
VAQDTTEDEMKHRIKPKMNEARDKIEDELRHRIQMTMD